MAMTPDELAADLDEERGSALGDVVRNLQRELAEAQALLEMVAASVFQNKSLNDAWCIEEDVVEAVHAFLAASTPVNSKKSD